MRLARRLLIGSNPRRTLVRIFVLVALAVVTFTWVLIPIRAEGISMMPTYRSGSINFVSRLTYTYRSPRRGDVVAIALAGPHVLYVKRVVGLPGERIEIVDGLVHVNAVPLSEPYVGNRKAWNVPEVTLGHREYFVIGDNRGMSAGEHDFGRVQASRIMGKVLF